MSKWNPIVLGRRAWAALRDLSRRWRLGRGSGLSRRVAANGSGAGTCRARQITAEQRTDAKRRGRGYSLTAIASGSIRPQNATSKFRCQSPAGDEEFRCQTIRKSNRSNVLTI